MEKEKLMEELKSIAYKYTDDAIEVVGYIIDEYEDGDDMYECIWQHVSDYMIYYNDAFNYLKNSNQTDFKDAIAEGFGENVCSIAFYYLEQEVFELLRELDIDY